MSENNKTIADIIAEKRELAEKLRRGTPSLDEIEAAVNLEFDANRIEAAWKRETISRRSIKIPIEIMPTGNVAAMREALKNLVDRTSEYIKECNPSIAGGCEIRRALENAKAALSKPSRNCDRFADELDAQLAFLNEVWLISVDRETMLERDKYENWSDEMRTRYGRWLLAPAAERKGEAK